MSEKRITVELPPPNSVNSWYHEDEGDDWFVELLPAVPEEGYAEPTIVVQGPDWTHEEPGTVEQVRDFALALLAAVDASEVPS